MASTVNIKITFESTTKMFRFSNEILIEEALKEIKERFNESTNMDHCLFQPATKSKKSRWLKNNRTFKFYGIGNGTELEYKKTQRPLKIILVDDSTKTVLIDSTKAIKEVIEVIGEKLMLKNVDEYSLKKVNTPDGEWLDNERTLNEEGVENDEVLFFAKKFFSSDVNIDKDDPIQLHLIFVQSSNAVVEGKYNPLDKNELISLAANHAQIVYGSHDVNKHKPGVLDFSRILPATWRKDKKLEKEILKEHKKLIGTPEINAKYRYVQLVRSLKTYGVTMYECVERLKGKKKGIKVLVGINRDKIVLLDGETKETKKEWNIGQLRRWAATSNTFTLDFGDYEEDYIVLQTNEGDAMSQLISGYIDLIMKARGDAGRLDDDDDAEEGIESMITLAPGSSILSATQSFNPGINSLLGNKRMMNLGQQVPGLSSSGDKHNFTIDNFGFLGQSTLSMAYPDSHKMVVFDVKSAHNATKALLLEMNRGLEGYSADDDIAVDLWRKQLGLYHDDLDKNINDLLAQARLDPSQFDKNTIDILSKKLHQNVLCIAVAAKNIASLDDDLPLLGSAKLVSESISRLFGVIESGSPGDQELLNQLFEAEKSIRNTILALGQAREHNYADKGVEALLKELIDQLRSNLEDMIKTAQEGSSTVIDPTLAKTLLNLTNSTKMSKDWLIGSLNALANVMVCEDAKSRTGQSVASIKALAAKLIQEFSKANLGNDFMDRFNTANKRLEDALKYLMASTDCAEYRGAEGDLDLDTPNNILIASLNEIRRNIDYPVDIVPPTKTCVASTNQIVSSTKKLADGLEDSARDRLLDAAGKMNEAMQDLLSSVREQYKNPGEEKYKERTLQLANNLEFSSQQILSDAGTTAALTNLRHAAKIAAAKILKLSDAIYSALPFITDDVTRNKLESDAENLNVKVAEILKMLQVASKHPDNLIKHNDLLMFAKSCIPLFHQYLIHSKRGQKHVNNLNKKQDVNYSTDQGVDAVKLLERACKIVSDMGGQTEIDEAMVDFDTAKAVIENAIFSSQNGLLSNIPGQTREDSQELLSLASRSLNNILDQLIESSKQGGKLSLYVKEVSSTIVQLSGAARSMASTVNDTGTQQKILLACKNVTEKTKSLINHARDLIVDRESNQKRELTQREGNRVKESIASLMNSGRALEAKECDEAIEAIKAALLNVTDNLESVETFDQTSVALTSLTKALTAAFTQLVGVVKSNPQAIGSTAKLTSSTMVQLLQSTSVTASSSQEKSVKENVIKYSKLLGNASIALLEATKEYTAESDEDTYNGFVSASENAFHAIQSLLGIISSGGSEECEEAVRMILNALSTLDDLGTATLKSNEKLLEEFGSNANFLATSAGKIVTVCRVSSSKLGMYSKETASIIETIVNASRSASRSLKGGSSFSPVIEVIQCCQYIIQNNGHFQKMLAMSKKAVVSSTKVIAFVKEISADLQTPEKKPQLQEVLKYTKLLANDSSILAKAMQSANAKRDKQSLDEIFDSAKNLMKKAVELHKIISKNTPQSQGIDPIYIEGIITSTKSLGNSSVQLIRSSSKVASKVDSSKANTELSNSSKALTDAITDLIQAISVLNPAFQECIILEETLKKEISSIDSTLTDLRLGNLDPSEGKTFIDSQLLLAQLCKSIGESILKISSAVMDVNPHNLVRAAREANEHFAKISEQTRDTASTSSESAEKKRILSIAKELGESLLAFIGSCKVSNPHDRHLLDNVDSAANSASIVISRMLGMLQSNASMLSDLDKVIAEAKNQLSFSQSLNVQMKYHHYRYEAQSMISKDLTDQVNKLSMVGKDNIGDISLYSSRILETLPKWVAALRGSIETTKDKSSASEITSATKELLTNFIEVIEATKIVCKEPTNEKSIANLKGTSSPVYESITKVVQALKKGAVGEALCEKAIQSINQTLSKIATSSIFAQAGQLEPDQSILNSTVTSLQQTLIAVVNKTIPLSDDFESSTQVGDDVLGNSAMEIAKLMNNIADATINTASRLNDSNSQESLLGGAKMMCIRSHQYILSGKDHSISDDKSFIQTFNTAKVAIKDSVEQFIKIIDSVTSEASIGERELQSVKEQILALMNNPPGLDGSTPEDVIKAARECTSAISDLVFSTTQDEIIFASQKALYGTENLINSAKTASLLSDDPQISKALQQSTMDYAKSICNLLELSKLNKQDSESQSKIEDASSDTTESIQNVVNALRALPGASHLSLDEVSDLEKLASSELEACAKVIEDAAAMLMRVKPKSKPKDSNIIDEETITNAILNAALAITNATGKLIGGATVCQNEREQRLSMPEEKKYRNDPTWANGLISAAKAVAGAVKQLVNAANNAAQGKADQEVLIASARSVAASTAQLVVASRAKSDSGSMAQIKLGEFAKLVTNATSMLVEATQRAAQWKEEMEDDKTDYSSFTGTTKAKFDQQIKILKLEAEIEKERVRMANLNKSEYSKK